MPYNRKSKKNLCPPWKPGQSGNPRGKAPGNCGYWRRLAEELAEAQNPNALSKESTPAVEKAKPVERIPCAVCRHSGRAVIDGLLTLGISLRAIARSYGFSKSSVERHKRRHLPVFPNAAKARQMKPIDEGLWQILNSRDGMRWSGPVDGAQRAIERLWKLNRATETGSPLDRFRIVTLVAFSYLYPAIWGYDLWNSEAKEESMRDYTTAIEILKSWGRDTGARESGG